MLDSLGEVDNQEEEVPRGPGQEDQGEYLGQSEYSVGALS